MSELINVNDLPLKCLRCNHTWIPRRINICGGDNKFLKPKVCPKCKSPYWNKNRIPKEG